MTGAAPIGGLVSPLFMPANRPERFAKAAASGADLVVVDLEDALPPSEKAKARDGLDFASLVAHPVAIRLNAIGTDWHEDDVRHVASLRPAAVMLPKAEDPQAAGNLAERLGLPLMLLVETALGHARASWRKFPVLWRSPSAASISPPKLHQLVHETRRHAEMSSRFPMALPLIDKRSNTLTQRHR